MIVKIVPNNKIVSTVSQAILSAKNEILATMLLSEEIRDPLPEEYHKLLSNKIKQGVALKRLGFGRQDEYNSLVGRYLFGVKYEFKYKDDLSQYQRMICIDSRIVFFGVEGIFLTTEYKPLIDVFKNYFEKELRKAKL